MCNKLNPHKVYGSISFDRGTPVKSLSQSTYRMFSSLQSCHIFLCILLFLMLLFPLNLPICNYSLYFLGFYVNEIIQHVLFVAGFLHQHGNSEIHSFAITMIHLFLLLSCILMYECRTLMYG